MSATRQLTPDAARAQRRRGWIAWSTAVAVIAVIVLAIIFGHTDNDPTPHRSPFGNLMTSREYAAARPGQEMITVNDRQQETGTPENLAKPSVIALFPDHADGRTCSYWQITDRTRTVARLCFTSPAAILVEKEQRRLPG